MPKNRQQLYWTCQCAGWGLYAVINTALTSFYTKLEFRSILALLSYALLGIGVTHTLRAVVRRQAWLSLPWPSLLWRLALAAPVCSLTLTALVFLVYALLVPAPATGGVSLQAIFFGTIFNMTFLIILWTAIYLVVHQVWRNIAQRETQLLALQAQINPHFFFNSLNSLRGLIGENPEAAQDAVTRLSQLMRYSLGQSRRQSVPLEEELATIEDYLAIEQIRFEQRLRHRYEIEAGCRSIAVPPMCLQTLVENALKHGIAKLPEGGEVQIRAQRQADHVLLTVSNPGELTPRTKDSTGVGLENVRRRLDLLYGSRATLVLSSSNGQTQAQIQVPL